MFVAINEAWKVPVGYFFCTTLNSKQKSSLISLCLNKLNETGVIVTNVTFDGLFSNFTTYASYWVAISTNQVL